LKDLDTYTVSGKPEHLCTVLKHCNIIIHSITQAVTLKMYNIFIIKIRDLKKKEIAQSRIGDKQILRKTPISKKIK
jgi:hypothetical protein